MRMTSPAPDAGPFTASASLAFPRFATGTRPSSAGRLRLLLIAGCTIAAGSMYALVQSGASTIDAELVLLLYGMAAIKTLMVAAAFALVAWRFGRPITPRCAVGYLVGMVLVSAATATIWQLAWIAPAALVFHAGGFLLLVVAWRDDGAPGRRRS